MQYGACNEDFIRQDALLVLVIITDEDDDPPSPVGGGTPGKPEEWFDAVVGYKGGIASNVVVLTLVGTDGLEHPNVCPSSPNGEDGGAAA